MYSGRSLSRYNSGSTLGGLEGDDGAAVETIDPKPTIFGKCGAKYSSRGPTDMELLTTMEASLGVVIALVVSTDSKGGLSSGMSPVPNETSKENIKEATEPICTTVGAEILMVETQVVTAMAVVTTAMAVTALGVTIVAEESQTTVGVWR